MSLMKLSRWFLLVVGFAALASGCVVNANDECYEVCDTVCEVRCNPWECWEVCWDECWDECTYVEYEEEYTEESPDDRPRAECSVDAECDQGEACERGRCVERSPGVGLCQPCERNADCVEEGARCLEINGEERVCGRACEAAADCPRGFECQSVSSEVGVPNQCVPAADPDNGARSCEVPEPEPEPEPGCRRNDDCAQGELCVDGACAPEAPVACAADADCGAELICEEGSCAPLECRRSADCADAQICVNARCEDACDDANPCPEGSSCEAPGYCAPSHSCAADADCPQGQTCQSGACVSL
jgi:hypothetical protein